jgi:GrpB-like predicted nucleotidyltransferase (UPF0157 family)
MTITTGIRCSARQAGRRTAGISTDASLPDQVRRLWAGTGQAPWWSYTVALRDWLRSSPDARRAYEAMKERVAAEHAGDGDYDDYTRGKAAFFREWQHVWAAPAGAAPSAAPGWHHRGDG